MDKTNSARTVALLLDEHNKQQQALYNFRQQSANKDKTLVAGAEAEIEQLELFKQELIKSKRDSRKTMIIAIIGLIVSFATLVVSCLSLVFN